MICKICSSAAAPFGEAMVLGINRIAYFCCASCGFIQTEEPYWLDEAYSDAITSSDVGLVDRNIRLARVTKVLLSNLFDAKGPFLDYGGGYGLFVRLMRDAGFDFHHYDKRCVNLLARGFEADAAGSAQYEALTAFEVFEHLVNPMEEIREMLSFSRNIIFTTELVRPPAPLPGRWWYYGTEHGQHVSFYTLKALEIIAQKFSLRLYTNGRSLHVLTGRRINRFFFRFLASQRTATFLHLFAGRDSLIDADYRKATGNSEGIR